MNILDLLNKVSDIPSVHFFNSSIELKYIVNHILSMFYELDLIIGFGAPILVGILYQLKIISKSSVKIFWLGALIGLTWEIPMFVGSYETSWLITLETIHPYPYHYSLFMISHTLWDGGLFLIGYWLVNLFSKSPQFKEFNLKELMITVLYGQGQELLVEFGAVSNFAWTFIVYWWNPALFYVNGSPITLFPQLVWLYGSLLFYFIVRKWKSESKNDIKE
jgi:hypothetical protein